MSNNGVAQNLKLHNKESELKDLKIDIEEIIKGKQTDRRVGVGPGGSVYLVFGL